MIHYLNHSGMHAYVHSPLFVFPNSPVAREAQEFGLTGGFNDWSHPTMDCRGAMDGCARMFDEVNNSAYLDRGSSITKVLLDHGYTIDEVRRLGILHNDLAREEMNSGQSSETRNRFEALAAEPRHGDSALVDLHSSPYRRVVAGGTPNAGARY